jgi:hypothetical protein
VRHFKKPVISKNLDTRYPKVLKKSIISLRSRLRLRENQQVRMKKRRLSFGDPFIGNKTRKTK